MSIVNGPQNGKEAEKDNPGSRKKAREEQWFRTREERLSGQKFL